MKEAQRVVSVWRGWLAAKPVRIALRVLGVGFVLLLTFTVAFGIASAQVCGEYEASGLLDCGGADGLPRTYDLLWRWFAVLLAAEVIAWLLFRAYRRRWPSDDL